ncbi:hypothetical protein WR25_20624 [Diploscapter pachys]|uniref:Uncharacterized protein n=1 Tax=Diploscapter pachys TaxID=2018661 RepID=A0A2A2KZN0_9BILA|nr:hypothetical protein WR25_20624 [Diploscapter pachys]
MLEERNKIPSTPKCSVNFTICITTLHSNAKCDILDLESATITMKQSSETFNFTQRVCIPNETKNVTIEYGSKVGASFNGYSQPIIGSIKSGLGKMRNFGIPSQYTLNVSSELRCDTHFFGPFCDKFCDDSHLE